MRIHSIGDWALLSYVPSTFGVTWDIMFEAVLLYLQRMVERPIQLLHCHLDRTLKGNGYD